MRETDKSSSDHKTRRCVAQSMEPNWGKPLRRERKKQEWANEQPKLDNARRLGGIYFDPEDEEYKEIIRNARRKLEVHMDATMPCKKRTKSPTSPQETGARLDASNKVPKTKYACMVEAHESTRQRVEPSLPQNHEDHIAGKIFNSMNHCNLVHKFILMPQAMKIPAAKAAVDMEWENWKRFRRGT